MLSPLRPASDITSCMPVAVAGPVLLALFALHDPREAVDGQAV